MYVSTLFALAALAAVPPAPAPDSGLFPAQLVADLESVTAPAKQYSWVPPEFVEGPGGAFYFFEDDGVHGRELWRSDGTALGTFLVRDVCPGQCHGSSFPRGGAIAALEGSLFFLADDGVHGTELWLTDGTALGTRMVRDVRVGGESSSPSLLTPAAGQLFFVADDGVHGAELWRSDGTAAGTYLYAEIVAGPAAAWIAGIVPGSDFLYLEVDASDEVAGLYRVDGTGPLAAQLAVGRMQGGLFRGPSFATLPDGRLLFQGGALDDEELWISDGTVVGTAELVDLRPAAGQSSNPGSFFLSGGSVYFVANASAVAGRYNGLWRTDGTVAGTVEVLLPEDVTVGGTSASSSTSPIGSRLFFAASDPAHGYEPWVLDESGAHLLFDIAPGPADSLVWDIYAKDRLFAAAGGRYVFMADDGVSGPELWSSDGTAAGTTRISSIAPGTASPGIPFQYALARNVVVNGHLAFVAWSAAGGRELWWSDGTSDGTTRLRSLNAETSAFFPTRTLLFTELNGISCTAAAGARLVFAAETDSRTGANVFGTDGTAAGTIAVATLLGNGSGVYLPGCVSTGSSALFFALSGAAPVLQLSGGEPATTQTLSALGSAGPYSPAPSEPAFLPFGGRWIGAVDTSSELWWLESDLSAAGTVATSLTNRVTALATSGQIAWAISPAGVLVGDGTSSGMTLAPPADGLPFDEPLDFGLIGDEALFLAYRESSGLELWHSDGTSLGTTLLRDIALGAASAFRFSPEILDTRGRPHQLVTVETFAILAADDGVHGTELWRTDGTAAGTVLLKDIYPGSYPSTPRDLVRVGDVVYFSAEDELHGLELWVTDGTVDGTHLVRDLVPGAESSVPQELTDLRGRLYFTAWRPSWGREAFQSDGTEAGTLQVSDVWPGSGSSSPSRFAAVRDTLYFAANDGVHGFELFKVIDATLLDVFADGFEGGSLGAWSRSLAH